MALASHAHILSGISAHVLALLPRMHSQAFRVCEHALCSIT